MDDNSTLNLNTDIELTSFSSAPLQLKPLPNLDAWRTRTFIQDIFQTWQSEFVAFSTQVD
jgi:hypothetical protein